MTATEWQKTIDAFNQRASTLDALATQLEAVNDERSEIYRSSGTVAMNCGTNAHGRTSSPRGINVSRGELP